ncbi:sacsin N-terminal ATP-binding-like domain-containing protein [Kineococcus endophyticus]|uniref:sacsin N-terminal ATP-binding-like domain-containing protein n=1 Tax=Kineococcus endophyticus TaxID=1181883 RepID=UPI003F596881
MRDRVLAAWNASPARLREDANAEEDAALGAYRDRLVVELAQNAADAATAAGVPGRLLLRLVDDPAGGAGTLLAANTGAPLTAAGVEGLSTLRASAKADADGSGSVGRFGVGFAAVLAVTDAPALRSTDGAVRFSRNDSVDLVRQAGSPGAVAELATRDGHVAALRLPFPAPDAAAVPTGHDTVVELPLRDAAARTLVEAQLDELAAGGGDVLLLALPGLAEVVVERPGASPVRTGDVTDRWRVLRRSGRFDPADVADRGVEDRRRLGWQLTWALPVEGSGARAPGVLCSPTPTDEDLPWQALLVGTFPLGPDRRRLAPGRATDVLLDAAAEAYGELLAGVAADGGDALELVPYGAAAGRVDAELRRRVLDRARDVPLLLCVERVDGAPLPVRPSSAVALTGPGADDPSLLAALAPALAGLVAAPRTADRVLTELGVVRMGLAEVLDVLPGQDAAGSRALFAALAPLAAADPVAREAMSGLAVPLLDGRGVHGARGLVLLDALPDGATSLDPDTAEVLAQHGLRVVDPAVADGPARDLLVRLGAREGGSWALLTDPAVRAAVAASPDAEDPDAVAEAVLSVVEAVVGADAPDRATADRVARDLPWLADLALPDDADDLAPAGSLVVPGTLAERAYDPAEVTAVHPDLLQEWGCDVLRAVGVLTGPALVALPALDLADPAALEEAGERGLADVAQYVEEVWADVVEGVDESLEGTTVEGVVAVRDLDLVAAAWPEVLVALTEDPAGTQAITADWVLGPHRRPGLTAWWLRRHGPCADVVRDPAGSAPAWLPPAPDWLAGLPGPVRRALGVLDDLATAGTADLGGLLRRSAHEVGRPGGPSAADLLSLWSALARAVDEAAELDVPRLAALGADGVPVAADTADVVVPDDAVWAQRTDLGPRLLVPATHAARVADLLDLDLASDRADGELTHPRGTVRGVPAAAHALVPGLSRTWTEVAELSCDGVPVGFWVRDGELLATSVAGAAAGLAASAGAWWARTALAGLLGDDTAVAARVLAEELPGLG